MSVSVRGAGSLCAAAVAVLGAAPTACAHPPSSPAPPSSASRLLGNASPSFRRATLQGGEFDSARVADRVLVVDFFASYCLPCRRSLPALEALHRRRPELAVVGVALDATATDALALVARAGLTFPVVHDAGNAIAGRFRVTELPASFVVDRRGRVAWAGGDGQSEDALVRAAESALAGERGDR
jgi:thiol-disulfide isomerase/thioredoxin